MTDGSGDDENEDRDTDYGEGDDSDHQTPGGKTCDQLIICRHIQLHVFDRRLFSLVHTCTVWTREASGFNPGLSVAKPASLGHFCHFSTVTQGAIRIMRISPELFREMLNRSISVVCPVRSMVNHDQFQTTDHVRISYGYAAVASRRLRLCTVSYGHLRLTTEEMNFLNMLKITPRKNQDGESMTEHHGHVYGSRTDGYSTDNPGLKP